MGIVPYEKPVGRGQCAPPLRVRRVSAGRRGNRRSAAGGGRSEPVSRKCPDWRPRQWSGIGWHDGGQSPTPTHSGMIFIKCHCEERSDVAIRSPYVVLCGGEYGLPHQCAHWFAMTFFGGAVRAGRCGHRPLRKACRAGSMCPAVEGTAYVGGGTHGCRPTEDMKVRCISMKSSFRGAKRRGNPFSPHDKKCGAGGYGLPHRRARRFAMTFFESAAGVGGASGKSAKRRRWRRKRAGFEEVPRLAATTVVGNRLARRRAIADPYA